MLPWQQQPKMMVQKQQLMEEATRQQLTTLDQQILIP
jgi:hypothetical protein